MRPQEKTKMRIELCAKAATDTLDAHDKKRPGECITKSKLFPLASKRIEWLMEDEYDPRFDEEAIGIPDCKFFMNHWPDICAQAADSLKKYIVWESRFGIRLGSFQEYQSMRPTLAIIAEGIAKNVEVRSSIIVKQGGQDFSIDIQIKQLPSGLE